MDLEKEYHKFTTTCVYNSADIGSGTHKEVYLEKDHPSTKVMRNICSIYGALYNICRTNFIESESGGKRIDYAEEYRLIKTEYYSVTLMNEDSFREPFVKINHITLQRYLLKLDNPEINELDSKIMEVYNDIATTSDRKEKMEKIITISKEINKFLSNEDNYISFKSIIVPEKSYLIDINNGDVKKLQYDRELSYLYSDLNVSSKKSMPDLNYNELYEALSDSDKELLLIIKEFNHKCNKLTNNSVYTSFVPYNKHVTTIYAKRLYKFYNIFMNIKEKWYNNEKVIDILNNHLKDAMIDFYENKEKEKALREKEKNTNNFRNEFWSGLLHKKVDASSKQIESTFDINNIFPSNIFN
jgi:hypothetical protein